MKGQPKSIIDNTQNLRIVIFSIMAFVINHTVGIYYWYISTYWYIRLVYTQKFS